MEKKKEKWKNPKRKDQNRNNITHYTIMHLQFCKLIKIMLDVATTGHTVTNIIMKLEQGHVFESNTNVNILPGHTGLSDLT